MADYKFTESGGVIHLATGMSIPNAPGNRHWQQYLEYVAAGGETLPWKTEEELLEQALTIKINEIISHNDYLDKQPIPFNGELYKHTTAVPDTIKACELRGLSDTDPIFPNNGMWDNYNNTTSTPFTVGDLKDLYNTGYDICAIHYGVAKYHIEQVKQLTTLEDIKNYDYTIGWDGSVL
jgi:hypothetical protein